jgi:hypothetical protein
MGDCPKLAWCVVAQYRATTIYSIASAPGRGHNYDPDPAQHIFENANVGAVGSWGKSSPLEGWVTEWACGGEQNKTIGCLVWLDQWDKNRPRLFHQLGRS